MAAILVSARLTGSSSAQCRSLRDSRPLPARRPCGPASVSLPFAVRPLPPPTSANPRARLRRRIRLLAPRVLRGACAEPRSPVSLRSALGRPARSSRNVFFSCAEYPHMPAPYVTLKAADSREAAAQAARGPEEPTVAREERRDRLSPRCSRLRKRILPRGMSCHVRLTDVCDRCDSRSDGSRELSGRRANMRPTVAQDADVRNPRPHCPRVRRRCG